MITKKNELHFDQQDLDNMKQLTTLQYDACKAAARERITKRIGSKPRRADYAREFAPLMNILDWIALLVFTAALVVSSTHIIQLMLQQSTTSYKLADMTVKGVLIDANAYTWIHQIGFILLAEMSAILFLVMHNLRAKDRAGRRGLLKHISLFGLMSLAAAVFVFAANLNSGIDTFIAILPPLFTIGIGFRLEVIIEEKIKRNKEIDDRYLKALATYEASSVDVTRHPEYMPVLFQEIWQKLVSLKQNQAYTEAPRLFKIRAVQREVERDNWTMVDNVAVVNGAIQTQQEEPQKQLGFLAPVPATASKTSKKSDNS